MQILRVFRREELRGKTLPFSSQFKLRSATGRLTSDLNIQSA
jgi:hypothetical protein